MSGELRGAAKSSVLSGDVPAGSAMTSGAPRRSAPRNGSRTRGVRARRRLRDEGGAASVLAVGLVAATLIAAGLLAPLCAAFAARQAAAGAADAAALAAADTASGLVPGVPCEKANRAAELNGARLEECVVEGLIARVTVSTSVLSLPITASARAGPPPESVDDST